MEDSLPKASVGRPVQGLITIVSGSHVNHLGLLILCSKIFSFRRGYHASTSPNTFLKKRYSSAFLDEAQSRIYPIEVGFKANLTFLCGTGRKQDFAVQPDHGFVRRAVRIWEASSETQEETAAHKEEKEEEE